MTAIRVNLEGVEETARRYERGAQAAEHGSEKTRRAFRLIGEEELEHQHADFLDRSRGGVAGGFGWRKVSPLTVLLRRTGRTAKLPGWAAVRELADVAPINFDTGRLAASLAAGAAGNVLRGEGLAVEVGSAVAYAARVHGGGAGEEPPIADRAAADKIVGGRILKVLPGHKGERTAGGRKSRARKNWNPEFFRLRGWLRKIAGRIFASPARPILSAPPGTRVERYAGEVKDAIVEDFAK